MAKMKRVADSAGAACKNLAAYWRRRHCPQVPTITMHSNKEYEETVVSRKKSRNFAKLFWRQSAENEMFITTWAVLVQRKPINTTKRKQNASAAGKAFR